MVSISYSETAITVQFKTDKDCPLYNALSLCWEKLQDKIGETLNTSSLVGGMTLTCSCEIATEQPSSRSGIQVPASTRDTDYRISPESLLQFQQFVMDKSMSMKAANAIIDRLAELTREA